MRYLIEPTFKTFFSHPPTLFKQKHISTKAFYNNNYNNNIFKEVHMEYHRCEGCLKPSPCITNPLTQISDKFISFDFKNLWVLFALSSISFGNNKAR